MILEFWKTSLSFKRVADLSFIKLIVFLNSNLLFCHILCVMKKHIYIYGVFNNFLIYKSHVCLEYPISYIHILFQQ